MRAGALDRIIWIDRRARVRDAASGELVPGWEALGKVRAMKVEGAALARAVGERWASDQRVSESDLAFRCRWNPALVNLTPDQHRIRYNQLECEILGMIEIGRREGVLVLCVARQEGLTAEGKPPQIAVEADT